MADVKHPILARDGWPFFFGGLVVLFIALKYTWLWLALLCVVYFFAAFVMFRDPYREVPSLPLAVVSPVDGKIINMTRVEIGLLNRAAIKITINIYKSGAYTTRSPTEGKIMSLTDKEAGSRLVERNGLWIRTDENDDVVMQMLGSGFSDFYPAHADVRYGERIGQGERCGLNRFAKTCVLYLPANAQMSVSVGQKVYAGSSVLAEYDHSVEAKV